METNIFEYNHHNVEVVLDEVNPTTITVTTPAGSIYRYIPKVPMPTKFNGGSVVVQYVKQLLDNEGNVVFAKDLQFNATTQELFPYFYGMMLNNISLGRKLDTMMVNGMLTELFREGITQIVIFDSIGVFYPPIYFEFIIEQTGETTTIEQKDILDEVTGLPTGEVEDFEVKIPIYKVTLDAINGDTEGDFSYKLLNSERPAQTSPVFEDLDPGEYIFRVTSPLSMPCTRQLTL